MDIPSRNKTDNIFEKVAERFPFFCLKTQRKCVTAISPRDCICAWPPVLSLWTECLFQAYHIVLCPLASRDKAMQISVK